MQKAGLKCDLDSLTRLETLSVHFCVPRRWKDVVEMAMGVGAGVLDSWEGLDHGDSQALATESG